jgi:hypothetical protein
MFIDKLIELLQGAMAVPYPECMSPDVIGELVYELCDTEGITQPASTLIAELCETLATELVTIDSDGNPGYK